MNFNKTISTIFSEQNLNILYWIITSLDYNKDFNKTVDIF